MHDGICCNWIQTSFDENSINKWQTNQISMAWYELRCFVLQRLDDELNPLGRDSHLLAISRDS